MARFRPASARDAALIFLRPVRIAVVAVLALCAAASAAQAWTTQISGEVGVHDWWRRIVRDPAGDLFAIAGPTTEKRAGSNGALLWSVTASDEADLYDHEPASDASGNLLSVALRRTAGSPRVVVSKRSGSDGRRLWSYSDTSGLQDPLPPLVDARGDLIVVGTIGSDLAAVKISGATGTRRWLSRLPAVGPHHANAAAIDGSGDVAVTGNVSGRRGSLSLVTKISGADGARLWFAFVDPNLPMMDVGFEPAGDILVAASQWIVATQRYGCVVFKLDGGTGDVRWRASSVPGSPVKARVDPRGGIVVTGWPWAGTGVLVTRLNGDGTLDWQRTVASPSGNEHVTHVAVSSDAVVVGGGIGFGGAGISGAFVFAVAAEDGRELWHVQDVGDGDIEGYEPSRTIDVIADGDGSVLVSTSLSDEGSGLDARIAKLAVADGRPLWSLDFRGTTTQVDDYAKSLVLDPNGDLIAAGILGSPASGQRGAAVKLSASDGRVLWRTTVDRLHGETQAAVDPAGDVFATGFVKTGPPNDDPRFGNPAPVAVTVVKLNGDDGQETWRSLQPSSTSGAIVGAPVVDHVGDVIAAFWSGRGAQVVKIDGEQGVATWTTTIENRHQTSRRPAPVAVDAAGDVLAGANTLAPAIAKLDGESGAIVWHASLPAGAEVAALATAPGGDVLVAVDEPGRRVVRRLLGASGAVLWATDLGAGRSKAVAVDRFGAVVVAGARGQSNGSLMSVVKLDGTTGAVRWEHGAATFGSANALTIGGAGNVFVAGSLVSGGAVRFTVRALRGTDGALSWSQSFVTGSGPSAAQAVTLDVAGRAVAAGALAGDARGLDFGVVSVVPGQAPPTCRFPRLCGG